MRILNNLKKAAIRLRLSTGVEPFFVHFFVRVSICDGMALGGGVCDAGALFVTPWQFFFFEGG